VQGFVMRINAPLDALPRRCLKKPVNGSRSIQDDHRASRSSRTAERYRSALKPAYVCAVAPAILLALAFPRFP